MLSEPTKHNKFYEILMRQIVKFSKYLLNTPTKSQIIEQLNYCYVEKSFFAVAYIDRSF